MRKMRAAPKRRLSGYCKAFIVLLVLFFAAGFAFLGSFKGTGKAFTYVSGGENTVVYNLNMKEGQSKLGAVYINVGNIYTEPGKDITVKVYRSTSSSRAPSTLISDVTIANLYSTKSSTRQGAGFNWTPVATEKNLTAVSISVSANANFDLNEIVCLDVNGTVIPLSVNTEFSQGFSSRKAELAYAIDAQDSFVISDSSYHNFTQEEAWYLTSVRTVLGGMSYRESSVYTVDTDFNSFATVLMLPSVALFGASPFALRLPSLLAACAALLFVYLLAGLLFKDDKYAFVFALLFAVCGVSASLARLGAPYMALVCFLLGSVYFMYRFFAKGISSGNILRGGLNIFWSGLFSAFALAMNILSFIPVLGVLVLFGFGLRRQKLAYLNEVRKKAGESSALSGTAAEERGTEPAAQTSGPAAVSEEPAPAAARSLPAASSIGLIGREAEKIKAAYAYKKRVSWLFAALSFVVCTFVVILLSSLVTYTAYVKAFDNPADPKLSYAALLWKGISSSFSVTNVTEYTEANAAGVLAWLLPLPAATVYDGILEIGTSRYLAWNVSVNAAMSVVALVAFIFSTISVLSELFSANRASRMNKRVRRIYLVLLGGLVTSLLASAFVDGVSALHSLLFIVFYIGFIPLAARIAQPEEIRLLKNGRPAKTAADVILFICLVVFVLFFALSVPSWYGFGVPAEAARWLFGWTSIADNGYFRP